MGRHRRLLGRLAALGPLAALSVATACGPPPAPAVEDGSGTAARNLILISLDTLRADRLGCYGYGAETSPALDSLAARGLLFERALSECSWTLPAHVSLLSGRAPRRHGVEHPAQRIDARTPLLAEHLADQGFSTFGTTDGVFLTEQRGFARGFGRFDERDKDLDVALTATRRFVEQAAPHGRYFAFVHSYDIHCPYEPRARFAREFRSPGAAPFDARGLCGNPDLNAMQLGPDQVRYLSDLYDASIRQADDALGTFLAWLEQHGHLEDTLVLVTSDHGEAFDEHGQIGHERSLHRELLHVPLIVAGPGLAAGRRLDAPVGLIDVVPSVLEWLELPPMPEGDGASLGRWLEQDASAPPEASAEAPPESSSEKRARLAELTWPLPIESVTVGDERLIVGPAPSPPALSSWADDPAEQRDLAGSRPERVALLLQRMERAQELLGARRPAPILTADELEPEQRERLRALGYLGDDG